MKYVKILGLAAVAAMAMMALLGAGSASATVLCQTTPQEIEKVKGVCPAGWDYPAGTVVDGSLEESATLWRTNEKDEEVELLDTCKTSTVKGPTANTGSSTETVTGAIEELTWKECTRPTETFVNGELEIHWISGTHNGTVTGKNTSVLVETIVGKCTFGTAATGTDIGTATGGTMGTIDIATTVPLIKDDTAFQVCPKTSFWTAKYTVTSPEPLYVATK